MPDPDRPTSQIVFCLVTILLPYLQVNRVPFPHMIHPCRPIRDMGLGAPFDSNAQVSTAITQPGIETNLIARSLKMKQGQDEWGRDGPYSRPSQFQRIRPRRVQTYRQPKRWEPPAKKVILSTEVQSTDRFDASGRLNRAPAAALSAGIDQVKRAWPAWLPGLDFGTKCKKNKTHQPNQLLPMVDKWSYFSPSSRIYCCLHTPCSLGGSYLLSLDALLQVR